MQARHLDINDFSEDVSTNFLIEIFIELQFSNETKYV